MTDEQRVKMGLLKEWAHERGLSNITLFQALKQRQKSIEEDTGPAIDRLYEEIEKGLIK